MFSFFEWLNVLNEMRIGGKLFNLSDPYSLKVGADWLEDHASDDPTYEGLARDFRFRGYAIEEVDRNLLTAMNVPLPPRKRKGPNSIISRFDLSFSPLGMVVYAGVSQILFSVAGISYSSLRTVMQDPEKRLRKSANIINELIRRNIISPGG